MSKESTDVKLTWNSAINAEESFVTVMTDFESSLAEKSLLHLLSEDRSRARLVVRPAAVNLADRRAVAARQKRMDLREKSVKDLNDEASEAIGMLYKLFNPECNARRSLKNWFNEDQDANLAVADKGRMDFNFRHAWKNFHDSYQPNKEVNLSTIEKKLEALTDEDISFAEFQGTFQKYVAEMAEIGRPPTVDKQYELLRNNVRNPNLIVEVHQLSLPEEERISINKFFTRCEMYTRLNKEKDSGKKRPMETVHGRAVTVQPPGKRQKNDAKASGGAGGGWNTKPMADQECWRCGRFGHKSKDFDGKRSCRATSCSKCQKTIGKDEHNARKCGSNSSLKEDSGSGNFPMMGRSSLKNSMTAKKSGANQDGRSDSGSIPMELSAAIATIQSFYSSSSSSGKKGKVSFPDQGSSS